MGFTSATPASGQAGTVTTLDGAASAAVTTTAPPAPPLPAPAAPAEDTGAHSDVPPAPSHVPDQAGDPLTQPDLPLRRSTEIQGDVLAGFKKDHVQLLFLTFGNGERARRWLGRLRHRIATTRDVAAFNAVFSRARRNSGGDDPHNLNAVWRSVGFTHPGLVTLVGGAPYADVPRGSTQEAFVQGMAARAASLGDTGANDPSDWLFGAGHTLPVHAVLTVAADRVEDLHAALARERQEAATHRVTVSFEQYGATLTGDRRGKEHFGFKDGISQPAVEGFDERDPDDPQHQRGKPGTRVLPAGEIVHGHPADHRLGPYLPDWMADGSFQVVRRLAQDVPGWWAQVADQLRVLKEAGAVPEDAGSEWLAARLFGRWRSGAPVAKYPDADPASVLADDGDNDVTFADDFEGRVTPLCSHMRKCNPRDGLKVNVDDDAALEQKGALDGRRIMRRGIPFGLPFDPAAGGGNGPDAPRGLVFVSYQADLIAQFEFVQRTWIDGHDFPSREPSVGRDAVLGREGTVAFPVGGREGDGMAELSLRQFVRTEGGVYAFAPSLSALKLLAEGALPPGGGPPRDRVVTAPAIVARGEVVSSGKARLRYEADNNLVVRDENENRLWDAGMAGSTGVRGELREDGSLVLVDVTGAVLWSTGTGGNPGAVLVVRADGDVVIRAADGRILWRTGTAH
ncbi:Dyp-type peroxidase [Streptomyces sp. NPDC049879]|uniref:Dyp-type peroxidase n=1 Tax=Streptomyces sp. NPDC049879 TaxID=3365598 RepID=UPI0037BD6A3A